MSIQVNGGRRVTPLTITHCRNCHIEKSQPGIDLYCDVWSSLMLAISASPYWRDLDKLWREENARLIRAKRKMLGQEDDNQKEAA